MIIWTIGLEGCRHHGLEAIMKAIIKELLNIDESMYYKNKRKLQHSILNTYTKSGDGDTLKKELGNFFSNRNPKNTIEQMKQILIKY